MKNSLQLPWIALAAIALGVSVPKPAIAAVFNQQPIDPNRTIAIAAPYNNGNAHQLLILEQISNTRQCWSESGNNPITVQPLLLNFDFTGICNRSTDSNGYSVRVGSEDLSWRYSLRLIQRNNDLILTAIPNQKDSPELEIGRTNGIPQGFGKIILNPGWQLTRRTYNSQPLGHIYLSNAQPFNTLIANAASKSNPTPTRPTSIPQPAIFTPPPQRPPSPNITNNPLPPVASLPSVPSVIVPTISSPRPTNTSTNTLPPVIVKPTPTPAQPTTRPILTLPTGTPTGLNYRVIVTPRTLTEQTQVKTLVPQAFRTTLNGQTILQAGLFREQTKASELYQTLTRNNLKVAIVPVPETDIPPPPSPAQPPTRPLPKNQFSVIIDPGHGGADPGAIGIGGLQEKDTVLSISRQVATFLTQQGIQATLTRPADQEIDLEPRVQLAKQANADIFVSIHANSISASRSDISGLETYHYSTEGRILAQTIHNAILEDTSMRDRGVRKANFYVIKYTSMPATLIEVGFVTGTEDAARLNSPTGRTQLAKAIARGITQYLRNTRPS